jgi:DNA polymerase-3 subunit epsilon
MRQVVLDTETTGLAASQGQRILTQGHRIIEIGCVELINRRPTGRHFHHYLNPDRDIDSAASAVHGIVRERVADAPRFAEIAAQLVEFIRDSELIIHNAEFDVAFLDMELELLRQGAAGDWPANVRAICRVLDTLTLARERHPGQRNNLDALCKRYGIDNANRDLHGALLDARLLADVYLAMTGGQSLLALDDGETRPTEGSLDGVVLSLAALRPPEPLCVVQASEQELAAHAQLIALLQKASGGKCLWLAATNSDAEAAPEAASRAA